MLHKFYLGLGANLGDRMANLRIGLRMLVPDVRPVAVSALYESAPWGVTEQGAFLNAVCAAETELSPLGLLARLKEVERALGRIPGPRWGPRPLDLDILLYDRVSVDSPDLQIPHPRLVEREFVLRPLVELEPMLEIPGDGRTVTQLLSLVEGQGVQMVEASGWERRFDEL